MDVERGTRRWLSFAFARSLNFSLNAQAILINILQTIYRIGPLHPSIRTSPKRIISLGLVVSPSSPSFSSKPPPTPLPIVEQTLRWFFASTCALREETDKSAPMVLRVGTPL